MSDTGALEDALGAADPVGAARMLLGAVMRSGGVAIRIVEVEAYGGELDGPWPDPAAHSFRGPTRRNSVMFGPAGRLYVYLSYGIHLCANIVCGPEGTAGAVLVRAGEVIDGSEIARSRRPSGPAAGMARGPGNVGSALALSLDDNACPVFDTTSAVTVTLLPNPRIEVQSGPRVGVSTAADRPWRFWVPGSPSVSAYRRSSRAPDVDPRTGEGAVSSS